MRALFLCLILASLGLCQSGRSDDQTSILWIYVDDMSDWLGCYGDTLAETPHLDALAKEGVRFERAFMPSPVCSTTRSALITGTMQTTHSLHHHRTMIKVDLPEDMLTIPELFKKAGYLTFNEAKDDYNFSRSRNNLYTGATEWQRPNEKSFRSGGDNFGWLSQLKGRRFFGQIQLGGGKIGGETGQRYPVPSRVDAAQVKVPPYYPDDPVFRNAIARHYEQIAITDESVGQIIAELKTNDLYDSTAIFFFTDHGSPLPRDKQFLYDGGLKVPLIVRFPDGSKRKTVRDDLVNGIDIPATSLGIAGIPIPDYVEGHDLFADDYQPQTHVIGARDRCGIAVDRIRTVRTDEYRYIKNYQTDRAFYQAQYRDRHASIKRLRELYAADELNELQAHYHQAETRPIEELYHLPSDPHQINNLAGNSDHADALAQHRDLLKQWQEQTDDKGAYPASQAELKAVYDHAKGKVEAPEYNFLK